MNFFFRAAEYLVRTGPVVTLEVAKQGAIYHGLATLLSQPSPVMGRGEFFVLFISSLLLQNTNSLRWLHCKAFHNLTLLTFGSNQK